jgi:cholesterol oxidase
MERAYDAIVVGSGFGGGIAACRLAEQGLRVCVLERGRRFGPGDYPDRLAQFPHALWHARHNPGGMFDVRLMKDVAVVTGAGVGGGSLVYANVQLRAPDEIFDDRPGRRRSTPPSSTASTPAWRRRWTRRSRRARRRRCRR